ncbi:MAG: hypothetical protein K1X64_16005 [Myxococcaceae bacterium]|nr:hypothetical protein [Myxococcaceae bacterium]
MRAPPLRFGLVAAWVGASNAWACAVCGAGQQPDDNVFLVMSVVISLVPLAMMGAIGYWVFRSARRAQLTPPAKSQGDNAPERV